MVVDVWSYVNRWRQTYIVYHGQHFQYGYQGYTGQGKEKTRDLDRAVTLFEQKYIEAKDRMSDEALNAQVQAMHQHIRNSKGVFVPLETLRALDKGVLIELTLDLLAQEMNKMLDKAAADAQTGGETFQQLINQSRKFNNLLVGGKVSSANERRLQDFFALIIKGLNAAGGISPDQLTRLIGIGSQMTQSGNFSLPNVDIKQVVGVTPEEVAVAEKVIRYLQNAADKLQPAGSTVSYQSFASTVNNIFSTAIGETVSKDMLRQVANMIAEQGSDAFLTGMSELGGQFKVDNPNEWNLGGSRKAAGKNGSRAVTSKVDVFNNDTFRVRFGAGEYVYEVELAANTSVKWTKGKSAIPPNIKMVNGTPLAKYFDPGSEERYLAYNVIAHRFENESFHMAYRTLRAATAATFFNDWMTGTGTNVVGLGKNRVQFLMVNGRIFSVMTIIRRICDELAQKDADTASENMPINMKVSKAKPQVWVPPEENSLDSAWIRSEKYVKEVLNKLTIAATLNSNVLKPYCY